MAVLNYKRPPLYAKQKGAFFCPERYSLIEGSTKSGKTVGSMTWGLEKALTSQRAKRGHILWVAPIYAQAEIAFRRYDSGLPKWVAKRNESKLYLTFRNGVRMWFKGGDNPDSVYGEDYEAAVIDEATRTSQALYDAVRSTLTSTKGPLRAIGNVRGRQNWHYKMCRKAEAISALRDTGALIAGQDAQYHYSKLIAQDAVDGGVLDQAEVDDAQSNLSERIFNELYRCIPSEDGGNPFGQAALRKIIKPLSTKPPKWFGIDLAKSHDWTVIIGLDEDGAVCFFDRWQTPWRETIARLREMVGSEIPAFVDSTGVGDPVLEELQVERGNFIGYKFTSPSKQQLMEGLALAVQQATIAVPEGRIFYELDQFEYKYYPTGVRYSAPDGEFDDCVCALALAQACRTVPIEGIGVIEYYEKLLGKRQDAASSKKPGESSWH